MSQHRAPILFNPRWTFRAQLWLIAVIPLAIAVLVAGLVYLTLQATADLEERLDESTRGLALQQSLLGHVLEAQTSLRGFALTGDETSLSPYTQAQQDFLITLQLARVHAAHDPDTLATLDRAESLFATYLQEFAAPVIELRLNTDASDDIRSSNEQEMIQSLFAESSGRDAVDELKQLIRDTMRTQEDVFAGKLAESSKRRRQALIAGLAGPLVAVGIALLLTGGLLSRIADGLRRLAQAAAELAAGQTASELDISDNRELARASAGFNYMRRVVADRDRQAVALDRLSRALQSSRTIDEAWTVAAGYLPRLLPGLAGMICAYRASRDLIEPVRHWQLAEPPEGRYESFEPGDCWALRSGYPHHFRPQSGDPACQHVLTEDHTLETLCVPLNGGEEIIGVMVLRTAPGAEISDSDRTTAGMVAETIALSIVNLKLREALHHQSIRDPLTGLYNRRYVDESLPRELSRSQRSGQPVSLIVLDADHFKRFNDSWGHDAGDAVLVGLARSIQAEARDMDIACRLGGEEFLLVLPRTTRDQAVAVAERLRSTVAELQIRHDGKLLPAVTVSLGVATSDSSWRDAATLIKQADQALYRAKTGGRNRVEVT